MKVPLLEQKCPYCGIKFTPARTNTPCCSSFACREAHKIEYRKNYDRSHLATSPKLVRVVASTCKYCGASFMGTNNNSRTCNYLECRMKREEAKREYAREYWRKRQNRKQLIRDANKRHKVAKAKVSDDGTLPENSLTKATGNIREKILNAWVETVFDLTDQIHLLFSECQHIRGCSSSLLATCLHEGSPSGCWAMHTLNRHRHV